MNEMVERVAVAMYRANPEHKRSPFCKAERWLQEQARDMARAAIAAMREPSHDVIVALETEAAERYQAAPDMQRFYGEDIWNAGIDAALAGAPAPIPQQQNTTQEKT